MAYTRVNWEDLPSTNTPINAENLNKMDEGIYELSPHVLYNNSNGSAQTITLNDSAANYGYLEIYFMAEDNYRSEKIYSPNGKKIILNVDVLFNTSNYYKNSKWEINDSSIVFKEANQYALTSNGISDFVSSANAVKITTVIGYK